MKYKYFVFLAIFWLTISVIFAQVIAPAEYTMLNNTISELGAQNYSHRWILKLGLIGFGVLLMAGFVFKYSKIHQLANQDIAGILYAMFVAFCGLVDTEPFLPDQPFLITESLWHSAFATLAGTFFVLHMALSTTRITNNQKRTLHLATITSILVLAGLFGLTQLNVIGGKGLIQRTMLIIGAGWLVGVNQDDSVTLSSR